jgi:hypothetical protein
MSYSEMSDTVVAILRRSRAIVSYQLCLSTIKRLASQVLDSLGLKGLLSLYVELMSSLWALTNYNPCLKTGQIAFGSQERLLQHRQAVF